MTEAQPGRNVGTRSAAGTSRRFGPCAGYPAFPRTDLDHRPPTRTMLRATTAASVRRCTLVRAAKMSTKAPERLPHTQSPITPELKFFNSVTPEGQQIPTYRVLDGTGKIVDGAEPFKVR